MYRLAGQGDTGSQGQIKLSLRGKEEIMVNGGRGLPEAIVFTGPMFSGKTDEWSNLLERAVRMGYRVKAFRPQRDTRNLSGKLEDKNRVCSRSGRSSEAVVVNTAEEMLTLAFEAEVVGIEEVQFFPDMPTLVEVVQKLFRAGKKVFVSGLDTDFLGRPFGAVHLLMQIPEFQVHKCVAICDCGKLATRSHRRTGGKERIEVGDSEYEPLCWQCWEKQAGRSAMYPPKEDAQNK